MTVDSRMLEVDLGIRMDREDWNALTLHQRIRKATNRGLDVVITMVRNGTYQVVTA